MSTTILGGESDGVADLDARCPWKGLDSYDQADGALFVGRERVVRHLAAAVDHGGLVGVVGPSGSGKSSLLLAGLSQHTAECVVIRPGAEPLRDLRAATVRLPDPGSGAPMLIVDQLEEIFTLCDVEDERVAYLDELCAVAESGRATVVVALRSDHYGSCAPYARFADALSRSHVLLGAPTLDELRRIITVPAHSASLELERGLDDEIVDDVLGEPGALPLLSHALSETWLRRSGSLLTRDAYRRAGGVRGAIARTAESTWLALPEAQQRAVRSILTRLGSVVSSVESSRRLPLAELLAPGDADGATALRELVTARLVTVDGVTAEVTHEAVFRAWPRLRGWLDEDRDAIQLVDRLRTSAAAWEQDGRDDASLYRGARLQAVVDLLHPVDATPGRPIDTTSQEFLDASVAAADRAEADRLDRAEQERRANRRLRSLLAAASVMLVVLAATGVFALRQRSTAVDERRIADARRLAAVAAGVREDRLDLAALLSIEAQRRHDDLDTRGALLATLTDQPGLLGYLHQNDATVDAAIDPTGETAAIPAEDFGVQLWDLRGGTPVLTATVDLGDEVTAVRLNYVSVGELLVGDSAGGVSIVDPRTAEVVMAAADHGDAAVWAVAASPDGRVIASSGEDLVVRLTDARTGTAVHAPLDGPEDLALAVQFSPDGSLLVVGGADGMLRFWDTETWEPAGEPIAVGSGVWDLAWLTDGTTFAVATDDFLQYYDVTDRQPVTPPLTAHDGVTYRLELIDEGATLVTSGEDGFIRFWDTTSHRSTRPALRGHAAGARIDVAPAVGRMVSSSDDGTIAVWDLRGSSSVATPVSDRPDGRTQVATTPAGRIFTGDRSGVVREFDAGGQLVGAPMQLGDVPIVAVAVSDSGERVAIAREDGTAQVVDVPSGKAVTPQLAVGQSTGGIAIDGDGDRLLTVNSDHDCDACFVLYDLRAQPLVGVPLRPPGLVDGETSAGSAAAFDPTGSVVATANRIGWIDAWDVATGAHLWSVSSPRGVRSLAFSPDGSRLAVGANAGLLVVLDAATGDRQQRFDGHRGPVVTVAFSPDGTLLASASSQDHALRVWRLDLGLTVGRPVWLGFDSIATLGWTDGGRAVAAPHRLTGVMIYDLDPEHLVDSACRLAGRNLTLDEWRQYFGVSVYQPTCPAYPSDDFDGSTAGDG